MRAGITQSIQWAVLLFSISVVAQCNVTWLYPYAGLTFNYVDTIVASWLSDCPKPDLLVWGPNAANSAQIYWEQIAVSTNGTSSFSFAQGVGTRTVWPFPAHFQLEYNATSDFAGVDGPVFSITSTVGAATTYASSTTYAAPLTSSSATITAAGSPTTITSAASSTASSPSSTATLSPPAASATGLSSSSKIGIGVGVPVGVILLLAIFTFWRHKKRQRPTAAGYNRPEMVAQGAPLVRDEEKHEPYAQEQTHELYTHEHPQELASDPGPHELDGSMRGSEYHGGAREKSRNMDV